MLQTEKTEKTHIQYMADIENVKEVALFGSTDLSYWQRILQPMHLQPVSVDGHGVMQISASDLKYMGRRFNEFTISVLVEAAGDNGAVTGFYLVHAYNTSLMFTLMERAFFSTPYYHASIELKETVPVSFALRDGNGVVLSAMFSGSVSAQKSPELWEGPLYLPVRADETGKEPLKLFYVSLGGETEVFAFSPDDTFRVQSPHQGHALQTLVDSHFTPTEWRVRQSANHKKSKTYTLQG